MPIVGLQDYHLEAARSLDMFRRVASSPSISMIVGSSGEANPLCGVAADRTNSFSNTTFLGTGNLEDAIHAS